MTAGLPSVHRMPGGRSPLRVAVILASTGRANELGDVLARLALQTVKPSRIVLSVCSPADVPSALFDAEVLYGSKGLCAQRNRGIEEVLGSADVIAFFDDDYVPSLRAVEGISAVFSACPDVDGATGLVLADGVTRGGISAEDAERLVSEHDARPEDQFQITANLERAYGCNMCFRTSAIGDLRFDENLPLYGWQEDVDFAARIAKCGRVVETDAFAGVHRGVSRARTPGVRLGYSQIINPIYLVRKGTMRLRHAGLLIGRNLLANHVRSVWPEPWVDRRGRAKGNRQALLDVVRGVVEPGRILTLKD